MPAHLADPKTRDLAVQTNKALSIDAVEKANSGHPGTPMGLAEVTLAIWARALRYDPKDPAWRGRDRFVLSAGHASMLLYSMLHLAGYDLPLEQLQQFRQWGSRTPGHPEHGLTPGVETTTGPLGQGIGNAVGLALGAKMIEARFGAPFGPTRVFCVASDGDVMEGVSGEASSIAGHLGVDGLVVFYDDNDITIEGATNLAFSEDVGKRYEAYGWFVQRIDGHDRGQIERALDAALAEKGRPSFIVTKTHIGHGAPNKQDKAAAHGEPLGKDEIALVKKGMGWDPEKHFQVPEAVTALFRERAAENAKARAAWEERHAAWRSADPTRARALDAFLARELPGDLYEQLLAALPDKDDATRGLSGTLQQVAAKLVPGLVGGSADLAPSTKTLIKGSSAVARGAFEGRNLHFGIREHGMGAVCNGLALAGGFVPYGATFLVFSDYMRPSVRLSALMDLPCVWIYTHDSIFLGEDGPTHQPVEHVWALRLIPNLFVARPADALEAAAAWTLALRRAAAPRAGAEGAGGAHVPGSGAHGGPTALVLTRQKVPTLKRDAGFNPKDALRGAYVVADAAGGAPDLVLVATGSEVHLAVGAKERLERDGRKVRVVSALCLEELARQPEAYRAKLFPKDARKVAIEAGRTPPWAAIVGADGLAIGIDHFGASAPDKVLGQKFGLTVDAVVERVQRWL